jgi:hypothetical protein
VAVPTDEIYEKDLRKAISEINDLADEIARAAGDAATVLGSGTRCRRPALKSRRRSRTARGVAFYGRAGQAILVAAAVRRIDGRHGTNCPKFAGAEPTRADEWLTRELHIGRLVVVMGDHALEFPPSVRSRVWRRRRAAPRSRRPS